MEADRARILDALVACAATCGLEAVTIDAVVAAAGVPRPAFAARFATLEDAGLAALHAVSARLDAVTAAAEELGPTWTDSARAGIDAALGYLAEDPRRLRFLCDEAPKLGRPAWIHHDRMARRYAERLRALRERHGGRPALPAVCYEVMTGAMHAVLRRASAAGRLPTVEEMTACLLVAEVPARPSLALVGSGSL
jgi:AcrR family transcriptional regulator